MLDLKNVGPADLLLRLALDGQDGSFALSAQSLALAAGSGWTRLRFSLQPPDFNGQGVAALADLRQFRLFHASSASFPGDNVAARLGADNASAVPEPGAALLLAAGMALAGGVQAQGSVLPDIPRGSIAVRLDPIATGPSAPAYATFAPGVADKLFVVEQNGLLRVLHNGSLQASPAMDMRSLVAPPLVPSNANDERGFLGLAFHPGFSDSASLGHRTLYTHTSELIPAGTARHSPHPTARRRATATW